MKHVRYIHLAPQQEPPALVPEPHRAVIILDQPTNAEWRKRICDWLVAKGCLYAMAWGQDRGLWHHDMDMANIAAFAGKDIPDDNFIMTTDHNGPLSNAFWFCKNSAEHPSVNICVTLLLHIALRKQRFQIEHQYRHASWKSRRSS